MFIIKIILCILFIIISFKLVRDFVRYRVWNSLREKYVNAIFEKIKKAKQQLLGLSMHYGMAMHNVLDANNNIRTAHEEEAYNILKALTEEISGIDPWIITELMTDKERTEYENIFKRFKEAEDDLNRTKKINEILSSPHSEASLDELFKSFVTKDMTDEDIDAIKRNLQNSEYAGLFTQKAET